MSRHGKFDARFVADAVQLATEKLEGAELREALEVFTHFDEGSKAFLDSSDLVHALTALFGYQPSEYEIERVMGRMLPMSRFEDRQGLCKDSFLLLVADRLSKRSSTKEGKEEELHQMFRAFDLGNKGFVTLEDLCSAANEIAPLSLGARPEVLADVFGEARGAHSGRVDRRAFAEIVDAGEAR